jgi:hypothetical protein
VQEGPVFEEDAIEIPRIGVCNGILAESHGIEVRLLDLFKLLRRIGAFKGGWTGGV